MIIIIIIIIIIVKNVSVQTRVMPYRWMNCGDLRDWETDYSLLRRLYSCVDYVDQMNVKAKHEG
jgi:hypothetical protein